MTQFFANSLWNGFVMSDWIGKGIVIIQIVGSMVMVALAIGKWRGLSRITQAVRRVTRDVMSGRDVLEYYLARHPNDHTPLENIYWATCERLLRLLAPDVRSLLVGRQPGVEVALTAHEMGLVKALSEHVLDEEEIRIEYGMGAIATVVALAPMLMGRARGFRPHGFGGRRDDPDDGARHLVRTRHDRRRPHRRHSGRGAPYAAEREGARADERHGGFYGRPHRTRRT